MFSNFNFTMKLYGIIRFTVTHRDSMIFVVIVE